MEDPEHLLEKAVKKSNSFGWFGSNKYDEAAELYVKAGNQFRVRKRWKEAGDAFVQAAELYLKIDERDEASTTLITAYKSFKKTAHIRDAEIALERATTLLSEKGRFHTAANYQKDLATYYEESFGSSASAENLEKIMRAYQTASEWYAEEDSRALSSGCLVKVAVCAARLAQYQKAVDSFEQVAQMSMTSTLGKHSVREYYLQAGLCRIAMEDHVGLHRALESYQELDASFASTQECRFLQNLLHAIQNGDEDEYARHLEDWTKVRNLEDWKLDILVNAQKRMEVADFT